MADIAMCLDDECPLAPSCHRYTAPRNPEWQSFADFERTPEGCDHYWPNEGYPKGEHVTDDRP